MTAAAYLWIAAAFAGGFALRGMLDAALNRVVTKVLSSAIGKDRVAKAMVAFAEGHGDKKAPPRRGWDYPRPADPTR